MTNKILDNLTAEEYPAAYLFPRKGISRMVKKRDDFGEDFSREREFKVILEDIQSSFRAFGEGLSDIRKRVENIEEQVAQIGPMKQDIVFIRQDIASIKQNLSFINDKVLPTVATKDDLKVLEKRLVAIEHAP